MSKKKRFAQNKMLFSSCIQLCRPIIKISPPPPFIESTINLLNSRVNNINKKICQILKLRFPLIARMISVGGYEYTQYT